MEEKAAIDNFTSNKENTMNAVLSSSVGMVLLRLTEKYLDNDAHAIIDFLYQDALEEIRLEIPTIAYHAAREEGSLENDCQQFEGALSFIEAEIEKPCNLLDTVTLHDKKIQMPLKEVFLLVWWALNDDKEYAHHYQGSEAEKLEQATKNKLDRQFSFLQCLIQLRRTDVCHQGIRHELVFLLNKVYSDVNIIEDATLTLFSYLKEAIFNKFIRAYEIAESDKRRCLRSSLITWMKDCDATSLVEAIDSDCRNQLDKGLAELFACHGSDSKLIIPFIDQALSSLEFSCDPQVYPLYAKMNYLLNEAPDQCELRSNALNRVQEIICQVQPEDIQSAFSIMYFQFIYQINKEIARCEALIKISGIDVSEFSTGCELYFMEFVANERFPKILTYLLEHIVSITEMLEELKKDKLIASIENFFIHWFMAENDGDKVCQKALYKTLLLDESVKKKILYSETEIIQLMTSNTLTGEKEITPYEINRIFLQAILTRPQDWSRIFYQTYAKIFKFVELDFNQNTEVTSSFKHDSYPEELLAQLKYLGKCYETLARNEVSQKFERPKQMILVPEAIRTVMEWESFSEILRSDDDETLLEQIYFRHGVRIRNILCSSEGNLVNKIKSIPKIYRTDFLLSKELIESIEDGFQLADALGMIPSEYCYTFLQGMGQKCYEIIENGLVLQIVLDKIPVQHSYIFLQSMGARCYELVNDGFQLASVLDKIPAERRKSFLQGMGKKCYEIIEDHFQLTNVMGKVPTEYCYTFLKGMGEKCHKIITDDLEFNWLTRMMLPEEREDLGNERTKYQANERSRSHLHSDSGSKGHAKKSRMFPNLSDILERAEHSGETSTFRHRPGGGIILSEFFSHGQNPMRPLSPHSMNSPEKEPDNSSSHN